LNEEPLTTLCDKLWDYDSECENLKRELWDERQEEPEDDTEFYKDYISLDAQQKFECADIVFDFDPNANAGDVVHVLDTCIDNMYTKLSGNPDVSCIADLLSLIDGQPYKSGTLRGAVQGDWLEYICPESISDEYLQWIASVLFNTGYEYVVGQTRGIDLGSCIDDGDVEYLYLDVYNEDGAKRKIADELNCSVNDIELVEYGSWED